MNKWILFLACFGMFAPATQATDIIFKSRAATTLNSGTLYTDSTFSKPSSTYFKGGHLFEILGETTEEHTDDSENQKFKWFRVRSEDGQSGWIYGDGLAVIVPDDKVKGNLKDFHKKKYHFDNGFDQATLWVASIELEPPLPYSLSVHLD